MTDRISQALGRLKRLAERAKSDGVGMDVPDIIEAIVGPEYDKEFENLVTAALETGDREMELDEIATGIMNLHDWRNENT